MRRRHRGAVEVGVRVAGHARSYVDSRRRDVRLYRTVHAGRSPAGEVRDCVVDVVGADRVRLRVVPGGAGGIAVRPAVSVGEGREDAGGDPGPQRLLVPQIATAAAPGVVHDVGVQVGSRVVTSEVGGSYHPLAGGEQRAAGAGTRLTALGGDPLRAGRDADLVAGAVVADHRAHRVRAVVVVVAGRGGGVAAHLRR